MRGQTNPGGATALLPPAPQYHGPTARRDTMSPKRTPPATQGELEAAVGEGVSRFEQEYMGRGPKDVHTFLLRDLLVVRLAGVLTAAEQQLVKTSPPERGRDLLKQVRTQLVETARGALEAMIQDITGVAVVSMHHDISTVHGEEVILFTLAEPPAVRDVVRRK